MIEATASADRGISVARPFSVLVDIVIVLAASALAFLLENFANESGWIVTGPEARGVSAVVGGALAAVAVVFARGGNFADLGFRQPRRWALVPIQAGAILLAFIAAQIVMPMLVSSVISLPAPDMSRCDSMAGDLRAAIAMALILPLTASIPEEIIYRGFLICRLTELFGQHTGGACISVLVQALLFGAVHFMWGVGGMIVALMMGIIWGTAYLLCGRNLWVVILAHSAGHMLGVVQLYLGTSIII